MTAKRATRKPARAGTTSAGTLSAGATRAGTTRTEARALLAEIALGEDSTRQFKRDMTNPDALASELVAFANGEGGTLFLGVDDNGRAPGLSADDVKRLNQLIANTASHGIRSPLAVQTRNVALANGRVVIVLTIPRGSTSRTSTRTASSG